MNRYAILMGIGAGLFGFSLFNIFNIFHILLMIIGLTLLFYSTIKLLK